MGSGASRAMPTSPLCCATAVSDARSCISPAGESSAGTSPAAHLKPFLDLERHSLLELEPPEHTRLRNLVNRAFVSRQVERLAPRIAALTNDLIDGFKARGSALTCSRNWRRPFRSSSSPSFSARSRRDVARQLLDWSHRMVAMYQFGVTRAVEDSAAAAAGEFSAFPRVLCRGAARAAAPTISSAG